MYRLGIDLGGTNIVAGVVDENYEIIAKASCKTNVPRPESEICDSMADVALKAIEKAKLTIDDIESIGIGVPGAVNPKTVRFALKTMQTLPLSASISQAVQRVQRMLLKSHSAQVSAAVSSSTARFTAVLTMQALSLAIWLS